MNPVIRDSPQACYQQGYGLCVWTPETHSATTSLQQVSLNVIILCSGIALTMCMHAAFNISVGLSASLKALECKSPWLHVIFTLEGCK